MYFDFSQRVLKVLCGYFAHERMVMFENNGSGPTLPRSTWSVLRLRIVEQDAMRCVFYVSPKRGFGFMQMT